MIEIKFTDDCDCSWVMTNQHSASSYGIPVLVCTEGYAEGVYGPADIILAEPISEDETDLARRLRDGFPALEQWKTAREKFGLPEVPGWA